jgi:SAM-dependent methyltransferase
MSSGTPLAAQRDFYDRAYARSNFFEYRERLYQPYIKSLVSLCGLKPGALVLDAGCGQGFFSYLLAREGMKVYGTDISLVGLSVAKQTCEGTSAKFFVSDLRHLPITTPFDCVFVRSCSVFNVRDLAESVSFLALLLAQLTHNGVLLFLYNTNLSGTSNGWANHSLDDIRRCLETCARDVEVYLVNKADVLILRKQAFSRLITNVNSLISSTTGLSTEAVGVCRPGRRQ